MWFVHLELARGGSPCGSTSIYIKLFLPSKLGLLEPCGLSQPSTDRSNTGNRATLAGVFFEGGTAALALPPPREHI
eukprot:4523691-Pleurochrysis_carterae.AAC.1